MKKALGELVTFKNSKGLDLDGIYFSNESNKITIIHVHGSFGNFYQNKFIRIMADEYLNAGYNFLSFNLSAHDGIAEGYRNKDDFEYVGGAVADFSKGIFDIEGAVTFAKNFSDHIILQGHSLGCDRVLFYLINQTQAFDFILLSPCDSYQLQENWIAPETVEEQISRLKSEGNPENEFDWLPVKEYGVAHADWVYSIPITRQALLNLMEGPAFQLIKFKNPASFYIDSRAFIFIGGNDALQTCPPDEMFSYFEGRIGSIEKMLVDGGDHMIAECEYFVTQEIIKWAKQI